MAINLANGRRYAFPELRKLGSSAPTELTSTLDLSRDGRTVLVVRLPWDDEPGPVLVYAVPFTGGKPKLLARNVAFARWRG